MTTSAKMKGTFFGNIIVKDANGIRFKGVPCIRTADNAVGYYDTGVVGFRTNMQALVVNLAKLSSVQSGQCTINMNARAVANVSAGTAQMYVLWIKET